MFVIEFSPDLTKLLLVFCTIILYLVIIFFNVPEFDDRYLACHLLRLTVCEYFMLAKIFLFRSFCHLAAYYKYIVTKVTKLQLINLVCYY